MHRTFVSLHDRGKRRQWEDGLPKEDRKWERDNRRWVWTCEGEKEGSSNNNEKSVIWETRRKRHKPPRLPACCMQNEQLLFLFTVSPLFPSHPFLNVSLSLLSLCIPSLCVYLFVCFYFLALRCVGINNAFLSEKSARLGPCSCTFPGGDRDHRSSFSIAVH